MAASANVLPAAKKGVDGLKAFIREDYLGGHSLQALPGLAFLQNTSEPTIEHREWRSKELKLQQVEDAELSHVLNDFEVITDSEVRSTEDGVDHKRIAAAWKAHRIAIPFRTPFELTAARLRGECPHAKELGQQYLDFFQNPKKVLENSTLLNGQIGFYPEAPAGIHVKLADPSSIYHVSRKVDAKWHYATDIATVGESRYALPCRPDVILDEKVSDVYVYFGPGSATITGIWMKTQGPRALIDDASQLRLRQLSYNLKIPIEDVDEQRALYPTQDVQLGNVYSPPAGEYWAYKLYLKKHFYVLSGSKGLVFDPAGNSSSLTQAERQALMALSLQREGHPLQGPFYHEPRRNRAAEMCRARFTVLKPDPNESKEAVEAMRKTVYFEELKNCDDASTSYFGK